jgi:predicted CoA-binding protein
MGDDDTVEDGASVGARVDAFLEGTAFAVVGASADRSKYGNRVLRAYVRHGRKAYPVNPNERAVEGLACYPDLASLPEKPHGVSVITPPHVTDRILEEAARLGLRRVWLQPGAESPRSPEIARAAGITLLWGGPCVLVELAARGE